MLEPFGIIGKQRAQINLVLKRVMRTQRSKRKKSSAYRRRCVLFTGARVPTRRTVDLRESHLAHIDAALVALERIPAAQFLPGCGAAALASQVSANRADVAPMSRI